MRQSTPPPPSTPPSTTSRHSSFSSLPRRDSELRNRRSSSISINSQSRYTTAPPLPDDAGSTTTQTPSRRTSSRNNSLSLSTSVLRTPSLDWNWPSVTGSAGAAGAGVGAGIIHYPTPVTEYTDEPEEFGFEQEETGLPTPPLTSSTLFTTTTATTATPATTSIKRSGGTSSARSEVPVESRSRDSQLEQQQQQQKDAHVPSRKRTSSVRKYQQQSTPQHTSHRSHNNHHHHQHQQTNRVHNSNNNNNNNSNNNNNNNMSHQQPQSAYRMHDSQDLGNDYDADRGDRAGGGGGGESSTGFLTTSDYENEYPDDPPLSSSFSFSSTINNGRPPPPRATRKGKYVDDGYEREYEEDDEDAEGRRRMLGGSVVGPEMSVFVQTTATPVLPPATGSETGGKVKRPTRKSSSKTLFRSSASFGTGTSSTNANANANTSRKPSSKTRGGSTNLKQKLFIGFLVILGLFLLGTVIVLSTIKRYFAIPDWAYLSEADVGGWSSDGQMQGLIPALRELNASLSAAKGLPMIGDLDGVDGEEEGEVAATAGEEEGAVWGPNGEGTGGYWMRSDWRGQVGGTDSWERLYNVSTRYVPPFFTRSETLDTGREDTQDYSSDVEIGCVAREMEKDMDGMPEYMLWTDDQSRHFIAEHYPQFLAMFDGYEYPIQRADAIRYFVLHHFGGIYMDLDIGCRRRLEPLISGDWDVLLPRTKPVGVSNDLIFSAKRHPFMEATIHGLVAFDHRYVTNYPTVMFSTGPMFLSAQYGIYTSAHPVTPTHPHPQIRILPKSLYGKNAKEGEAPHSFFAHYYGSSWHADDAGFITFLGSSGKLLMYLGMAVFVLGGLRYVLARRGRGRSGKGVRSGKRGLRRLIVGDLTGGGGGGSGEGGAYHMVSLLPTSSASASRTVSPVHSRHTSGSDDETITIASNEGTEDGHTAQAIMDAVRRAGNFILAAPATLLASHTSSRSTGDHTSNRSGVLYFLPAFFAPVDTAETTTSSGGARPGRRARTASMASMLPSSRTTRTAVGGGRRSRQSSYAQSRLESGNYHQQHYHHPAPQSLSHGIVSEEDERYLSPSEDAKRFPSAPPPYETSPEGEDPMHEVDVFLKSQE
ncbi:hypothetical protein QFC24_005228 [Naganishia onofrii]|uniref:Uncharacterized protein n=1 Tax=Naganishia onofrii TaxID=1851511 RepID=A0ACC2XB83_9TREE|nr:hypothetical protein QFC24_005228 [Naganishia onofrii]